MHQVLEILYVHFQLAVYSKLDAKTFNNIREIVCCSIFVYTNTRKQFCTYELGIDHTNQTTKCLSAKAELRARVGRPQTS